MSEEVVELAASAVEWVSDDFPGFIRVRIEDAQGRQIDFVDKVPVFGSTAEMTSGTRLPCDVTIAARIVKGGDPVQISTDPDGVRSVEGQDVFLVHPNRIRRSA